MRKSILALLILLSIASGQALYAQNSDGQIVASQYGNWQVSGYAPNSYNFSPTACRVSGGGSYFFAFAVGAPIKIMDGRPALNEIVTPTAVTNTNVTCAISIAPLNDHQNPYYLTSGTGGLQEAINNNLTTPVTNTVVLTAAWYQLVGTANAQAVIAAAKGSAQLGLVDVTQVPSVFYQWNGTNYVALTPGGGGSCTTCVTSVNGLSSAVGIVAGNGNVTIGQTGQNITISAASGGGGGSSLGTLQNDLVANNAGNTAAIDMLNFLATIGYTPQAAITQAVTQNGMVTLTPGVAGKTFTNTSSNPAYGAPNVLGVKVQDDDHLGALPRSGTEQGMQCDARVTGIAVTSASPTATIFGDFFYLRDKGKTLTVVGAVSGVPTAFETVISNVASDGSSTATMTTAAPFTLSGSNPATLGTDDTAAMNAAAAAALARQQSGASQFTALVIPGGQCLIHTFSYNGISIEGLNGAISALDSFPGEDAIAEPDPALGTAVSGNGVHIHDLTFNVDNRIDATLAWKIVNDSGTTNKSALYRPAGLLSVWANNPLSPQWFQGAGPNFSGAIDGAASVTNGVSTITIPAGMSLPVATNKIVFPYANGGVFTATVSSVNTGTRVVTLNATYPGTTASQAVWFAGVSPQTLSASITSGTCPASITLTNPIIPGPASESSLAAYGTIRIDNEQFTYFGKTNAFSGGLGTTYLTITGCAQNGTSRANHSSLATVVPLNPFQPATPWPATPTVNAGQTTPTTAAIFPAWNIGNSAFAAPNSNGNLGVIGAGSFANSTIDHIFINSYPVAVPANRTGSIYLVGLPYSTGFENITINGTYFGPIEGQPSLNTGGLWASSQPTADGSHWFGLRISTCVVFDFISGGQNSFKDFNVYSNCYSGTAVDGGGSAYYGADAGMAFTNGWSDEGLFPNAGQSNIDLHNMYEEGEFGSRYGLTPGYEFDLTNANWDNLHIGSGQELYIGGTQQKFTGGNFNNQPPLPIFNYGSGNSSEGTQEAFSDRASNTYGISSLINYGKNASFSSALGNAFGGGGSPPYGATQLGNSREPWHGQDELPFILGFPLVNENGGYIPASEFNNSFSFESQAMNIPYAYDATLLPDGSPAGGSTGCALNAALISCVSYLFNQGTGIHVGPGQRIAGGKYTMSLAVKGTGTATSFTLQLGVCAFADVGTYSVPVTSAWSIFSVQVDLTSKAACNGGIALGFGFPVPANDNVYVAYANFAPVANTFNTVTLNATTVNSTSVVGGTVTASGLSASAGNCITIATGGVLSSAGAPCGSGGGGGSLSSVGLTMPSWFTVANSPLVVNGTIAVTANTGTPANQVVASPNGSTGAVAPRALVAADIPALPYLTGASGDITITPGAGGVLPATVTRINGQSLSLLATGLLQNNIGSGIPSIAQSFNITGLGQAQTLQVGVYNVPCTNTPVFDPSQGNVQILTLTTGCNAVTSSSITNLPAAGDAEQVTFIILQDSTGGRPFPNPAWASGWTPIQQTASGTTVQTLAATSSGVYGDSYNSAFCALSGSGPLACGTAYKGYFTIPAGSNPTQTVNTTAVGSQSIIILTLDDSICASVVPAVTCNATIPSELKITTKNAGVSFTAQAIGTFTGNPIGVTYVVVNP